MIESIASLRQYGSASISSLNGLRENTIRLKHWQGLSSFLERFPSGSGLSGRGLMSSRILASPCPRLGPCKNLGLCVNIAKTSTLVLFVDGQRDASHYGWTMDEAPKLDM